MDDGSALHEAEQQQQHPPSPHDDPDASPDPEAESGREARHAWQGIVRDVLKQQESFQSPLTRPSTPVALGESAADAEMSVKRVLFHIDDEDDEEAQQTNEEAHQHLRQQQQSQQRQKQQVKSSPAHQQAPPPPLSPPGAQRPDVFSPARRRSMESIFLSPSHQARPFAISPLVLPRAGSKRELSVNDISRPHSPASVQQQQTQQTPRSILDNHELPPLQALNFLPTGQTAEKLHAKYPSLTHEDFEDINSFLDPADDARWTYTSLFSWSQEKLDLLLAAVQPEHLTLIAHRSMSEQVTQRPVDVAFRNLNCFGPNGETKLQGVSGYALPGMMMAVWGAPDSGVSSFLALLAGCYRHTDDEVTGELLLNGAPMRWKRNSRQIGFVAKTAENFATMTVAQTFYFSAKLRLPRLPENILQFRVGLVCKLLGLSHVRDSIVGSASVRGLSGGERKRVSYGCELIVGYSLILCEQPTDGLDIGGAMDLMQNFKITCGAGRSMITSLATASEPLFDLFDFLLLLSKGACIYFGPRVAVMHYLKSQGFEPPAAASGERGMSVPDFLQALSATPERFWKAQVPIQVRQRPVPWLSEEFPFFYAESVSTRFQGQGRKHGMSAAESAAVARLAAEEAAQRARANKYLLQVEERMLARRYSDVEMSVLPAAQALQQLSSPQSAPAAASDVAAGATPVPERAISPPPVPTRRRAWRRLLRGWRASDLNADCAYVLDFDLRPIGSRQLSTAKEAIAAAESQPLMSTGSADDHQLSLRGSENGDMPSFASKPFPHGPNFDPRRTSFGTQLWLCFIRQAQFTYKNKGLWLYNWYKTIVLALILGTLFYDMGTDAQRDVRPRFGFFYFILTFYGNSAIQMVSVLLSSRSVVMWESFSDYYHPLAFSLSLMLVFIPIALVEMFLFTLIIYPLSGLYGGIASVNFLYMWLQLTLAQLTGRGWILMFSTLLPTQQIANIVTPVLNLLISAICGYLNPADNIPRGWIWVYYLSYYAYGWRGLCLNEIANLEFQCPEGESCAVQTGFEALQTYSISTTTPERKKWLDMLVLFCFYLAFHAFAALALMRRKYQPREDAPPANFGSKILAQEDHGTTVAAQAGLPTTDTKIPALPSASSSRRGSLKAYSSDVAGAAAAAVTVSVDEESLLPVQSTVERHVLSWFNLSYSVRVPQRSTSWASKARGMFKAQTVERKLLDDVSGVVATGQLIALMGTSGAGKSTLLDVIAQKKTTGSITGEILWDGQPLPANFPSLVGYVEQFDSLQAWSTIRETLFFSGRLRLPSVLSDAEIDRRVSAMLELLELTPVASERIGSQEQGTLISPELRKKVSIAVELMAEPKVLFLDEPTTGLDSMSSLLIARLIRSLSRRLLVCCTIHQPSTAVVEQFDVLLLLKPPGALTFYGSFDDALRYFGELPARFPEQLASLELPTFLRGDNPSDWVLGALKLLAQKESSSSNTQAAIADGKQKSTFNCRNAFLNSAYAKPMLRALQQLHGETARASITALLDRSHDADDAAAHLAPLSPRPDIELPPQITDTAAASAIAAAPHDPSTPLKDLWLSFRELTLRFARSTWRARVTLIVRACMSIVYGFVTGTLFFQLPLNQQGAVARVSLLYFVSRFSLFSANLKLPGVFSTRVMMLRETSSGMYAPLTYAFARTVADLPWMFTEIFLFICMMYFPAGLTTARNGRIFALAWITLSLNRILSIGFIELIGAFSANIELAQSSQTFLNMLFMVFSGYFVPVSAIPRAWRWANYLSPFYYSIRFMAHNEALQFDEFSCPESERVAFSLNDPNLLCPITDSMRVSGTKCPLQCGADLLQVYSIPIEPRDGYLSEDIGVTVAMACGYTILAALALKYKNFIKR